MSSHIEPTPDYSALVAAEAENIAILSEEIAAIPGAQYVDVVTPLQSAAMGPVNLYLEDSNGHPVTHGYSVIADAVTKVVRSALACLLYTSPSPRDS